MVYVDYQRLQWIMACSNPVLSMRLMATRMRISVISMRHTVKRIERGRPITKKNFANLWRYGLQLKNPKLIWIRSISYEENRRVLKEWREEHEQQAPDA